MNNRRKKPFRILAAMLCIALVLCVCSGYQARAESTPDYPVVSNATEFLQAFAEAKNGDIIGISDAINFYNGVTVGDENKRITIIREREDAFIYFSGTGSYIIQNIVFDGNEIESMYPMVYATRNITVKSCEFYNCICNGDGAAVCNMERTEFYNCTFKSNSSTGRGGHVSMSEGIFDNCVLMDGSSNSEGGAVACSAVDFNNCLITRNHAGMYGGGIYTSGITVLTGTKLYNNTAGACGADYVDSQNGIYISESIEELAALYKSDGLKPINWETTKVGFMTGGKLILEKYVEKPDPEQPTNPEEPETPIEPENPDKPDTPTEPETPDQPTQTENPDEPTEPTTPDESSPSDNEPEQKPDDAEPTTPAIPSDSAGESGGTTTNSSSESSTDNSNRSTNSNTTTDNSRRTSTNDSNNTSTVNNYYTQQPETQLPNNQPEVQTIVVPVGNGGNGEPIEQTIRIESSSERSVAESAEGMTLNINMNVGSEDTQQQPAATAEQ